MNVGHVRAEMLAAVAMVEQAVRVVGDGRDSIRDAVQELATTVQGSGHPKPQEALNLWTDALAQAEKALARLHEGKGHALAMVKALG